MKKIFITLFYIFSILSVSGQNDTIFCTEGVIPCTVKEVKENAVTFVYPNEEVLNTIYKNTIHKIVFKSGRVQTFSEATALQTIDNVDDYEKITITSLESEVQGLYKLGDVSAKAVGTTELSNQERVKNRAYRKIKIAAAMMGANIIYLTHQRTEGNKIGYWTSSASETNLTGIAYTNTLPDFDSFKQFLAQHASEKMKIVLETSLGNSDSDMSKFKKQKPFEINNLTEENRLIMIDGKYRVVGYDETGFNVFYRTKSSWYNLRIEFDE